MTIDFYEAVKIAAVGYTLYKVWCLLFGEKVFRLWDRTLTKSRRPTTTPKVAKPVGTMPTQPEHSIMGTAKFERLEDPFKNRPKPKPRPKPQSEPEPVSTTALEPTGFIGEEKPVSTDDFDAPEPPYIPSEDELDIPPPDDNELFSSGISFEDLGNAVEVLTTDVRDETRRLNAAKTVYHIQNTELEEFFTTEVSDREAVKNLLKECLDTDGFPLKKHNSLAEFRIEDYV